MNTKKNKLNRYVVLFITLSMTFTFVMTMLVFYYGYYIPGVNFKIQLLHENTTKINTAIQDNQAALINVTKLFASTLDADIDDEVKTSLINEYVTNSNVVAGMYQIDKNGSVSMSYPLKDYPNDYPHLDQVLESTQINDTFYFTEKIYDPFLEKNVIYVLLPTKDFIVITAHEFKVESLLEYYQVDRGVYIAKLIDNNDQVIFSSNRNLVNFNPVMNHNITKVIDSIPITLNSYTSDDGEKYLSYSQDVPNSDWRLNISVKDQYIFGKLIANLFFPVFFSIIILISIFIAYRQIRIYVSNPLNILSENIERVFKNELDDLIPINSKIDILFELNENFFLMQKAIEEREANLEEFTFIASHDLQEPLRMITSYLRIIEMEYASQLDKDGTKYMNYVSDAAVRMKTLIDDLLLYSRSGKIDVDSEVDLNLVVDDVLNAIDYMAKNANAQFDIKSLPTVQGNYSGLKQVFQNLITNSIKFSTDPPVIKIWYKDDQIYLKDNGIGLDKKYENKIFMAFQRLHNRSKYPGTGIGLAIVKKVIEKHGWKITVHSKLGLGSTFIIDMR